MSSRLLRRLRACAYAAAVPGLLLTAGAMFGDTAAVVPGGPLAIGMMGGAVTASPYVLFRALEAYFEEQAASGGRSVGR